MKKLYIPFILSVFFSLQAVGQIVPIPDVAFKQKLISSNQFLDANNNGQIEVSEALDVDYISFEDLNGSVTSVAGLEYFTNLIELVINGTSITTINVAPLVNLNLLQITNSDITSLDVSALSNLEYLHCQQNHITTLTLGSVPLKEITCYSNSLTNMTAPATLLKLDCFQNQIHTLNVSGSPSLKTLTADENVLTNINLTNCPALTQLSLSGNGLLSLNISQNGNLEYLDCSYNAISSLGLVPGLKYLFCSGNDLTSLNVSGQLQLMELQCDLNEFTELNLTNLPALTRLLCRDNYYLTSLDISEVPSLKEFSCDYNPIMESINLKNGTLLTSFYATNNASLQYICVDEAEASFITNYLTQNQMNNVAVNTYCTFSPGGTSYTITGSAKLDATANGCDVNDALIPMLKYNLQGIQGTSTLIANGIGTYNLPIIAGSYTLSPAFENQSYYNISPASVNVNFPTQTSPQTNNFCITPNGIHRNVDINIIPVTAAVPGFNTSYKIIYRNIGNAVTEGSISLNYDDAVLDYVTASPDSEILPAGSVFWTFMNLLPFETRTILVTLNLNTPMETPALNSGDVLSIDADITVSWVSSPDENTNDNHASLEQNVVNAMDPNEKVCLEGNYITPEMVGKYIHYLIRFENLGTAPAQNIVVKDMIDATKFDVSTLLPIDSSHPFATRINGNKVEFIFEGINLPFDDADNDGYVSFKIKTLPTLVLGVAFSNSASIYFDYNFPVITDPAVTTVALLGVPDHVAEAFTLYPNPAANLLHISAKNGALVHSVSVSNVLGQVVRTVKGARLENIDLSSLHSGTYLITIESDKGSITQKFIKN